MTASVCMGIYNGEKFIEQQLYTILHQTKKPDEVILCDDGSTDHTVEKIQDFIRQNQLQDRWQLFQNPVNKGYPDNFYYAMSLCGCDIVFLADQDDIWGEQKIAHMCQVMERNPDARAVCCKFGLIDAEGKDIHTIMSPTRAGGTMQLRQIGIEDVFYKCEWPGMTVAYDRKWFQSQTGTGYQIPHDLLVCARAAEEKGFYQMDEILAYHRRHSHNTGKEEHRLKHLLKKSRKLEEIEDYLNILQLFMRGEVLRTDGGKEALQEKLSSMQGRYEALRSGKRSTVMKNAWKNRNSVRLATLICDLLIVKQ